MARDPLASGPSGDVSSRTVVLGRWGAQGPDHTVRAFSMRGAATMAWPTHSATEHPTDWPAIRRRIRARDHDRCQVPVDGKPCGSTDRLQVDRITPWSQGGGAGDANLRLTCHAHHAAKTGRESHAARRARAQRAAPAHPSGRPASR